MKNIINTISLLFCLIFPCVILAQPPSKLSTTLKYKEQLGLSNEQLSQLTGAIEQVNSLKKALSPDTMQVINNELNSILKTDQYKLYLSLYFQSWATYWTKDDWSKLIEYRLVNEGDRIKICKEIYAYELKKPIELEALPKNLDRKSYMVARSKIEEMRPAILQKLDVYSFARKWVNINWNLLKKFNLVNNADSLKINQENFSYEVDKAFAIKNATRITVKRPLILLTLDSYVTSGKTWQKIKKYDLNIGKDSTLMKKQIQEFQYQSLLLDQKFLLSQSPNDALEKYEYQQNKLEILKELDAAIAQDRKSQRF